MIFSTNSPLWSTIICPGIETQASKDQKVGASAGISCVEEGRHRLQAIKHQTLKQTWRNKKKSVAGLILKGSCTAIPLEMTVVCLPSPTGLMDLTKRVPTSQKPARAILIMLRMISEMRQWGTWTSRRFIKLNLLNTVLKVQAKQLLRGQRTRILTQMMITLLTLILNPGRKIQTLCPVSRMDSRKVMKRISRTNFLSHWVISQGRKTLMRT